MVWEVAIRRLGRRTRDENGRVYVPQILVFIERPEDLLVRAVVLPPESNPSDWERALREASDKPRFGDPRLPSRLIVESNLLRGALRRALSSVDVRVGVGDVPGVDLWWSDLALENVEEAPLPDPAAWPKDLWDDRGRVWAGVECLRRRKPWEIASHWQPLQIDLQRFGRESVIVATVGQRGAEDGIIVVDDLMDFDLLAESYNEGPPRWWAGGVSVLALTLEEPIELPPGRLREVERGGWPENEDEVVPVIYSLDEHGRRREATPDDCLTLAVCAEALSRFVVTHREIFDTVLPPAPQAYEIELEDSLPGETVSITCPPPG